MKISVLSLFKDNELVKISINNKNLLFGSVFTFNSILKSPSHFKNFLFKDINLSQVPLKIDDQEKILLEFISDIDLILISTLEEYLSWMFIIKKYGGINEDSFYLLRLLENSEKKEILMISSLIISQISNFYSFSVFNTMNKQIESVNCSIFIDQDYVSAFSNVSKRLNFNQSYTLTSQLTIKLLSSGHSIGSSNFLISYLNKSIFVISSSSLLSQRYPKSFESPSESLTYVVILKKSVSSSSSSSSMKGICNCNNHKENTYDKYYSNISSCINKINNKPDLVSVFLIDLLDVLDIFDFIRLKTRLTTFVFTSQYFKNLFEYSNISQGFINQMIHNKIYDFKYPFDFYELTGNRKNDSQNKQYSQNSQNSQNNVNTGNYIMSNKKQDDDELELNNNSTYKSTTVGYNSYDSSYNFSNYLNNKERLYFTYGFDHTFQNIMSQSSIDSSGIVIFINENEFFFEKFIFNKDFNVNLLIKKGNYPEDLSLDRLNNKTDLIEVYSYDFDSSPTLVELVDCIERFKFECSSSFIHSLIPLFNTWYVESSNDSTCTCTCRINELYKNTVKTKKDDCFKNIKTCQDEIYSYERQYDIRDLVYDDVVIKVKPDYERQEILYDEIRNQVEIKLNSLSIKNSSTLDFEGGCNEDKEKLIKKYEECVCNLLEICGFTCEFIIKDSVLTGILSKTPLSISEFEVLYEDDCIYNVNIKSDSIDDYQLIFNCLMCHIE